jgi:hypothetical protein
MGSSTAPGWMKPGNEVGIGAAQAPCLTAFRKVPTCEIADAPGISTATSRASIVPTSSACADHTVALHANAASTAATTAKLEKLLELIRCFGCCRSKAAQCAGVGKPESVELRSFKRESAKSKLASVIGVSIGRPPLWKS